MTQRLLAAVLALVLAPVAPGDEPCAAEAALCEVCAAKAAEAEKGGTITVRGRDGWLFFSGELRHVAAGKFWGDEAVNVSRATKPDYADPLPAILDFKRQLDERGIDLLIVPVPPKVVVYPDHLAEGLAGDGSEALPRLDSAHRAFYGLLREKGVAVVDLTDEFLGTRDDGDGALFCRQDTHWSGRACVMAATRIAGEVAKREWLKAVPRRGFAEEWRKVEIAGDLWRDLEDDTVPRETLRLRFVGRPGEGGLEPVETDRSSPVILLGDSHTLVFHAGGDMHAHGAGLADQLARELGLAVDLIGVRGSGATPARTSLYRRSLRDPDYLAGKRLVIWCFSAREFTESMGWQRCPVGP